jgi:elongation factor P
MATANDLRRGMAINYNGDVTVVLETQHRTPGNLRAFVQATFAQHQDGENLRRALQLDRAAGHHPYDDP